MGESQPSEKAAGAQPDPSGTVLQDDTARVGEVGTKATDGATSIPDPPATCVAGRRLCETKFYPGPSGYAWRHGFACPDKPGERISASEYPASQPLGSEPWRKKERRW